jgi:membrane protein required for beta-lactamase induction
MNHFQEIGTGLCLVLIMFLVYYLTTYLYKKFTDLMNLIFNFLVVIICSGVVVGFGVSRYYALKNPEEYNNSMNQLIENLHTFYTSMLVILFKLNDIIKVLLKG